jgi:ABC-2 type transport system permease protein
MMNVTRRLLTSELRLLLREPLVLAFVCAFPMITVLVLGGVFDDNDPSFEGVLPSDFYIAAYFGIVIAAVGLIMLPVHIASYREAGVLRRFDAAGFPRWTFPISQYVVGAVFVAIGAVILLATAALAYGLPGIENVARTTIGIVAGSLAFISIGVLLGTLLPNARAAQGVGLLLFLPMFLLAGGGPPPEAMSPLMNDIASALPLTHVVRAIQEPWLGLGTGTDHLIVVIAIFVAATLATLTRSGSLHTVREPRSVRRSRGRKAALHELRTQ